MLSWAARGGHAGTIALLLRHGAQVNVPDRWGRTPLIDAADHGSPRCVALLLEAGADPGGRDAAGLTALDHARRYAGQDLAEVLRALLTCGRCGPAPDPEQVFIERTTTQHGETTVCVGVRCGSGARTIERTDGFDRVVRMLGDAPGNAPPG